ncbi:MAG: 50S ribosomal protein L11 methyltransferase [Desulfobacteraceae bacterium]|nr:50S ribosomal protein L11 methyltransferase [Desulfobacteraceae bacterium]
MDFDRDAILAILENADTQVSARVFVHKIAARLQVSLSCAKTILKHLVNNQDLAYQDLFGNTYVTKSFQKPVRITDHFFLIPPDIPSIAGPGQLDIRLLPGISFGSGHHPTTRLCLAAIEYLFFTTGLVDAKNQGIGADIGTGSGVLAIALCLAGLDRCQACDIDPNAVSEAKKNIATNTLSDRIRVFDHPLPDIGPNFRIICANLRTPTLENLALFMRRRLQPGGMLLFSGIRDWETKDLVSHFNGYGFVRIWEKTQNNWTALILTDATKNSRQDAHNA